MTESVAFTLNGAQVTVAADGGDMLLDVLRGPLGHTGVKEGCGKGECGACTVLVSGRAVNACLFPALEAEGADVVTIEGLAPDGRTLSAVQEAFVAGGGIQCGFCSPGMIISVTAVLDRNRDPTEDDVREALRGNLCRCTGYVQIVRAAMSAAQVLRRPSEGANL